MKEKVTVIGGGLGGLSCGYMLAKNGMDVTVLEKEKNLGGCLQSFERNGMTFDTGMHYVGSLADGEALNALFRYFGLMDLPWVPLNPECFDEVFMGGVSYRFANGHDRFADVLSESFPQNRKGIAEYVRLLKKVGDGIFDVLEEGHPGNVEQSLLGVSAYGWLNEVIRNPLLVKVLSGSSIKMELQPDSLPLYTFAQINDSFIRSAWRLKGGGGQLAETLAGSIRAMGGRVIQGMKAVSILEDDEGVSGVCTEDGETFESDIVISSLHPALTVSLTSSEGRMRRSYRKRVSGLENTGGVFTANIRLRPDKLPYIDRNIYVHAERTNPWKPAARKTSCVMLSFPVPAEGEYASSIDLLCPMNWDEVSEWQNLPVGRRGNGYMAVKQKKAYECLMLAERRIPEIWEAVDKVYMSTPVTWNSYIGSPEGGAFGIRKDFRNPMLTVLTPKTPVPGLYLTGQSLNLHGVLGVTMTSLLTCAEIIGIDKVREELKPFIKDFKDNR